MASLLQLFFPVRCSGCGLYEGDGVCQTCKSAILAENVRALHVPGVRQGLSLGFHEGVLRKAILDLKFQHKKVVGKELASLLAMRLLAMRWPIDLLVSVPMTKSRARERSYNPPGVVGESLAQMLGIISIEALKIRRPLRHQVGLGLRERRENVRDAFEMDKKLEIKDKSILLLDDVMTTGSTLSECARVLKDAGALDVYAVTLALEEKKD